MSKKELCWAKTVRNTEYKKGRLTYFCILEKGHEKHGEGHQSLDSCGRLTIHWGKPKKKRQ